MRKRDYDVVDYGTLEELYDIVSNNSYILMKKQNKLNRKVNLLAIIFGGILLSVLNKE